MGNTYVVQVWKFTKSQGWHYEEVWRGEERKEALAQMDKWADTKKYGCIIMEYRP